MIFQYKNYRRTGTSTYVLLSGMIEGNLSYTVAFVRACSLRFGSRLGKRSQRNLGANFYWGIAGPFVTIRKRSRNLPSKTPQAPREGLVSTYNSDRTTLRRGRQARRHMELVSACAKQNRSSKTKYRKVWRALVSCTEGVLASGRGAIIDKVRMDYASVPGM